MLKDSYEAKSFQAGSHSLKLPVFGMPDRHSLISTCYSTLNLLWCKQSFAPTQPPKYGDLVDKAEVAKVVEVKLLQYSLSDTHIGFAWHYGSKPSMNTLILHEAMCGGLTRHTVGFERFLEGFHRAFNALPYTIKQVPTSNEVAEYYESSLSTLTMLERMYSLHRNLIHPQWFDS